MALSICKVHTNQNEKETTPHGSAVFPVACYEDDMKIVSVHRHWHDEYEYIIAVKGHVTVTLGSEKVVLNKGEAVFINSGCLHSVKPVSDEESVLRSLVILQKFIGGTSDSIFWQTLVLPFSHNDAPDYIILNDSLPCHNEIKKHMLLAWDSITKEHYDFENYARYHISCAIRILSDYLSEFPNIRKKNDATTKRMKTILSYVENHYMEDLSNQYFMDLVSCSESVLLRSFQQIIGISPMQYVLQFRIEKAAELLLSTNEKSCAVARSCGFHDFSYFTKTFKRNIGLTPIEFRKKNKKD